MTTDLRPKWLNVTRSLQKAACKNSGIAVVSSQIVVDNGGDPVTWTEPVVTKLGPLSSQDDLIRLLGSLASSASNGKDIQIAQVLDSQRIVVNQGEMSGITAIDWFVHLDKNRPYAILSVNELRDRITILQVQWLNRDEGKNIVKIGQPVHKIHW